MVVIIYFRDLLKKGGSAMDATIGAMFCNGIVNSHSMGLGGGFMMTIYSRNNSQAYSLIARESAPLASNKDLFIQNTKNSLNGKNDLFLLVWLNSMFTTTKYFFAGGLAVGIPGELIGYWEAWKRFGRLEWTEILEPTLELCRDGYHMSKHQYDVLNFRPAVVRDDPILR